MCLYFNGLFSKLILDQRFAEKKKSLVSNKNLYVLMFYWLDINSSELMVDDPDDMNVTMTMVTNKEKKNNNFLT